MSVPLLRHRIISFLLALTVLGFVGAVRADPPTRVARLGYTQGSVSFSPAGDSDWERANVNRTLIAGDRLWVDDDARAEIQDGSATIRLEANTSVAVSALDDRVTQLQLTQGRLNIRLRHLADNQVVEVSTPNLMVTLRHNGDYRIAVDPALDATDVIVRAGQAQARVPSSVYQVDARQFYRFRGDDLSDYEFLALPRPDEFDRWASERDRAFDNSVSARYVSRDVVGYQDLDAHGYWEVDRTYGNVWIPNRVAANWAPYRDGHWSWITPWGWTWVDDAPWGFAVSHYGRWNYFGSYWGWVPGPRGVRAYYAPALVAFVGGQVGAVAWVALAPYEVYRPSYRVSRHYFENINRSNTIIRQDVINNFYNNNTAPTQVAYANRLVTGAVVAVPRTAFVQSQPVAAAVVRLPQQALVAASLAAPPAIAPNERVPRGGAERAVQPPPRAFERSVIGHAPGVARPAPDLLPTPTAPQAPALRAPTMPLIPVAPPAPHRGLEPAAALPNQRVPAPMLTPRPPPSAQQRLAPAVPAGPPVQLAPARPTAPAANAVNRPQPQASVGGVPAAALPATQPPVPRTVPRQQRPASEPGPRQVDEHGRDSPGR